MWILVGELRRVIERPNPKEGTAGHQIQILAEETLQNGEIRETLFTLGTGEPEEFHPLVGEKIFIECSPFARKDGSLGVMAHRNGRSGRFNSALLDT